MRGGETLGLNRTACISATTTYEKRLHRVLQEGAQQSADWPISCPSLAKNASEHAVNMHSRAHLSLCVQLPGVGHLILRRW